MTAKRWLVTGGCGFIGRALVADLMREGGHAVRIVDNLSVGSREDLAAVCEFAETDVADEFALPAPGRVELLHADILDAELALRASEGVDVIVHLAANTGVAPSVEDPRMDCVTNVIGTLNYLEAARHAGVPRFVFASSGAPAGEVEPPIHEELPPHPVSPYGASKLAGEGYCSAYARTFGVDTVALRFGNVYGPLSGKKSSVVAKFIRQAMGGERLEINGDGTQTRDFLYIDDLVQAVRLAADVDGVGGEVFQIATNQETSVMEMTDMLLQVFAEEGLEKPEIVFAERRLGDVMRNYSDTSKARARLGWQVEVALGEGLRRTVRWFIQRSDSAD